MRPGIPWSVKGIEPEVREAAKYAARRSGLSLGEWLNHLILEQADMEDDYEDDYYPRGRAKSGYRGERLGRLSERLERLDSGAHETAHARLYGGRQKGPDPRIISDVLERLQASERRTETAFETITERLEELASQITSPRYEAQAEAQNNFAHGAYSQDSSVQAVEQAIRNIVSHMEVNETRMREQFTDMQARINKIGDGQSQAGIETKLSEIAKRLEKMEGGEQAQELLMAMEGHIARVNTRIDEVQNNSELGRTRAEMAGFKQRMDQLEETLREEIAAQNMSEHLQAFHERLENAEGRLEHVVVLENSIREIIYRLENQNPTEEGEAQGQAGPSADLLALESALGALAERTQEADEAQKAGLQALQQTLEGIADKLASLEAEASLRPEPAMANLAETPIGPPPVRPAGPAPEFMNQQPVSAETAWQNLLKAHVHDAPMVAPELPQAQQHENFVEGETEANAQGLAFDEASSQPAMMEPLRAMRLDQMPDEAAPPPSRTEDFVAAARRAALAAQAALPDRDNKHQNGLGLLGNPGKAAPANPLAKRAAPNKKSKIMRYALIVLFAAVTIIAAPKIAPKLTQHFGANKSQTIKSANTPAGSKFVPAPSMKAGPESGTKDKSSFNNQGQADFATASLQKASSEPTPIMPIVPQGLGSKTLGDTAIAGNAEAQFILATRLLEGKPSPDDSKLAAQWLGLAAAKGLAPAQYRLAALYELGRGVGRDFSKARDLYERAASQGHVKAMHNLGVLLAGGANQSPEYGQAVAWFEAAAIHGLPDSQFNLAVFYERGAGIEPNPVKASFWYGVLAQDGDEDAKNRFKSLQAKLTPKERERVAQQIAGFVPKEVEVAKNQVVMRTEWAPGADVAEANEPIGPNDIMDAQRLLSLLGYPVGKADGVFSEKTANAVRIFQLQNGMPVNGMLNTQVLSALREKQRG